MASTPEALFDAIERDDEEAVRAIVEADPSAARARDTEGVSALMRARYRSRPGVIAAVRAAVPDLDAFEASALGEIARLAVVLDEDPDRVGAYSADGFTPLHLAAFFGAGRTAGLLLDRGADPDAPGRGWMTGTPLNSAAASSSADIVVALLSAGADPNARQAAGWTPLHSAAHNGDLASVDALLAAGGDPAAANDEGTSVLDMAIGRGDGGCVAAIRAALA